MKPAKHQYTILKQICQHIPAHLVPKLARSFGVDKKARSFSPWSHVVAMLHVQIAHSLSLNDVADTLRNHSGVLTTINRLLCIIVFVTGLPVGAKVVKHARYVTFQMAEVMVSTRLFQEILERIYRLKPLPIGYG